MQYGNTQSVRGLAIALDRQVELFLLLAPSVALLELISADSRRSRVLVQVLGLDLAASLSRPLVPMRRLLFLSEPTWVLFKTGAYWQGEETYTEGVHRQDLRLS